MITILLPAYNEAARIFQTIDDVHATFVRRFGDSFEIIVSDDGSRDGTSFRVEKMRGRFSQVSLITAPRNEGKGAALRKGIEAAKGSVIAFLDADGDISAAECLRLVEMLLKNQDVDGVVGSKRISGSVREGERTVYRVGLARAGNWLVRKLLVPGIRDTQCGIKVFRSAVLKPLAAMTRQNRWSFDMELLALAHRRGLRLTEEAIVWRENRDTHVRVTGYVATLVDLFLIWNRIRRGVYG